MPADGRGPAAVAHLFCPRRARLFRAQDAHVAAIGLPGKPDCSFFGVFDGHGGATVSRTTWVPV